jgi:ribosome-interacting GTPase 1
MDKRIVEEIAEIKKAKQNQNEIECIAYARYVDDMIIVANSFEDLDRLRTKIEESLNRLGLELSPKTKPLPSMTKSQVRNWRV